MISRPEMKFEILTPRNIKTIVVFALALLAGFIVTRFHPEGLGEAGRLTLGIFTTAAILWILEPFPLYVTSFVIVILEVILLGRPGGPLDLGSTGYSIFLHPFFDSVIVLLLGGFVLATALKRYGLDQRISRAILSRTGTSPRRVLLGMMVTSAFLSMWLSNTATTAMMIAVAIPIVSSMDKGDPFRKAIILGIPFASNIGGIGTPIGTPPNAIAVGILAQMGLRLSFIEWMARGIPVVIILLILAWLALCRIFPPRIRQIELRLEDRGPMGRKPKFILVTSGLVVLLWLTSKWHGVPSAIVSLIPVVVFFGLRLLRDDDLQDLGWGILFIVGGGMSLGIAMRESGLTEWIVGLLPFESMGTLVILLVFAVVAAALTSFISNSATANLLLPIAVGVTALEPTAAALVVAIAASAAMILPVSTPPNAIAYGSGLIKVRDMALAGGVVTAISIPVIAIFVLVFS
jgi:sodium-dependent dicarboxylate transporter 2/3/5